MAQAARRIESDELRAVLRREHEALNQLFADVVDAFETNNGTWAARCFGELEKQLEAHLAMEEKHLFPALERIDPAEARTLRREHSAIRAQIASLGVGVDLHATRAAEISELIAILRVHAAREDALLYPWAEANVTGSTRTTMLERVRERLATLAPFARSANDRPQGDDQ